MSDFDHSERLRLVEKNMDIVTSRLEGAISRISEAVHEISVCMQQLVTSQEVTKSGAEVTKSALDRAFGEIKDHNSRISALEKTEPGNKSTTEWVRLIIVLILGAAIGYLFNK